VVLDAVPPPRTVADMCRALRGNADLAEMPILAITSSDDVEERIPICDLMEVHMIDSDSMNPRFRLGKNPK